MGRPKQRRRALGSAASAAAAAAAVPPLPAGLLLDPGMLEAAARSCSGSNALVLPAATKRTASTRKEAVAVAAAVARKTKSQLRKLRRLQEEKESRQMRSAALATLQSVSLTSKLQLSKQLYECAALMAPCRRAHRLDDSSLQLLLASSSLGQDETMRERLRKAVRFERAGLAPPDGVPLYKRQHKAIGNDSDSDQELQEGQHVGGVTRLAVCMDRGHHAGTTALQCDDQRPEGDLPTGLLKPASSYRPAPMKSSENAVDVREPTLASTSVAGPSEEAAEAAKQHIVVVEPKKRRKSKAKKRAKFMPQQGDVDIPQAIAGAMETASARCANTEEEAVLANEEGATQAAGRDNDANAMATNDPVEGGGTEAVDGALAFSQQEKSTAVPVHRSLEVQRSRSKLPILMMEQEIMEAISERPVVIVCGETGCGKTTQVPQFLYEAGYGQAAGRDRGMVGVTQPRRVAVLATARRVANELGSTVGAAVGFQVRHDRHIGDTCAIKFMTDGILLREVQSDFLLKKYSVIVLDEAHERSLNTDILIGLLSRIVPLRQKMFEEKLAAVEKDSGTRQGHGRRQQVTPLKLVLMSATLRLEDFAANQRLFPTPPPVIAVPARQFPVTVHFSQRTELADYLGACRKKVKAIHTRLPPGGVLVFVTGQHEVEDLCRTLRRLFPSRQLCGSAGVEVGGGGGDAELDRICGAADGPAEESSRGVTFGGEIDDDYVSNQEKDVADIDDDESETDDDVGREDDGREGDTLILQATNEQREGPDTVENKGTEAELSVTNATCEEGPPPGAAIQEKVPWGMGVDPGALHVVPLYAALSARQQFRAFAPPPEGARLVVVATNVAETSLTIPGIRYVVDSGRAKVRSYDLKSGVSHFMVQWISKASANQRAGRAGRTGPGHCYRLYSSALYNDAFSEHSPAEITRAPVEGVVLQMKAMGIDKVANFPFPTTPPRAAMLEAHHLLTALSALSPSESHEVTPIGKAMALYPISPRSARLLVAAMAAVAQGVVPVSAAALFLAHAVAAAAALSLESPMMRETGQLAADDSSAANSTAVALSRERKGELASSSGKEKPVQDELKAAAEQVQWQERRKRKRDARAAQSGFRDCTSDALTIVNALHAYEAAEQPEVFCTSHFLHARRMHEIAALRRQLAACALRAEAAERRPSVWNALEGLEQAWRVSSMDKERGEERRASSGSCAPPRLGAVQRTLLRRAVLAGWADRIARRVRPSSVANTATAGSGPRMQRAVRYQACSLPENEFVYLHPSASTYADAPQYLAYTDIVQGAAGDSSVGRCYLACTTAVDPQWLSVEAAPLCIFLATGGSTQQPQPATYDVDADRVVTWVAPVFGPHRWELPQHAVEEREPARRTAAFAAALLRGRVLPALKAVRSHLSIRPEVLLAPGAHVQRRSGELLAALGAAGVTSRRRLASQWARDSRFLLAELTACLQGAEARALLQSMWAQLLVEAGVPGVSYEESKALLL
eukprot:SM000001S04527  [mRNA]  locus=s1:720450:727462:+ [translate_table: standard]